MGEVSSPSNTINLDSSLDKSVELLGVRIDGVPMSAAVDFLVAAVMGQRKVIADYVNIHALNLAYEIPWFRDFLNRADLIFCDGFGVQLGARFSGQALRYRYTPPDWLPVLARRCVGIDASCYLVGGHPGIAVRAAEVLRIEAPGLRIAGTQDGYFDKSHGCAENQAVIDRINACHPDVLLVGFGMPAQEKWIQDNLDALDTHVILPVGAAFDYLSGSTLRAPRWMTDHGLEWLGRLVIEPRRLWKRYLIGNPKFFWRVLRSRFFPDSKSHRMAGD